MCWNPRHVAPILFNLLLAGCGPGTGQGTTPAPVVPVVFDGVVRYEARHETPTGISREGELRPARFVRVRIVDESGTPVAEGTTDAVGHYALEGTSAATTLEVYARIVHDGHDLAVSRDPGGGQDHVLSIPLQQVRALAESADATAVGATAVETDHAATAQVDIRDAEPMAGALHILDMLYEGATAVKRWVDVTLPPFFAYWGRGITTDWSFYTGERPHGSGRYTIELLGGEPGQQATTDTDEHDELIVLHEFGHFVMDVLSSDSSPGGQHPRGFLLDPGLAWEEGRATWFATMVKRSPMYLDTIGIEPGGSLRVSHDLERGHIHDVRGMGSESSVAEVLWDLADGADGVPDQDHDGVALGPAGVLRAMIDISRQDGAHPALPGFLRHLADHDIASEESLRAILILGGHPTSILPPSGVDPWPRALALPGKASDKIDGLSDPAPSGGPPRPLNGQDAVHVYRVHLPQAGRLSASLVIFGSGRGEDHEDLDLELRDIRTTVLDRSVGETPRETVSRSLEPGWYLLTVRDGGQGNRAGYELEVRLD